MLQNITSTQTKNQPNNQQLKNTTTSKHKNKLTQNRNYKKKRNKLELKYSPRLPNQAQTSTELF